MFPIVTPKYISPNYVYILRSPLLQSYRWYHVVAVEYQAETINGLYKKQYTLVEYTIRLAQYTFLDASVQRYVKRYLTSSATFWNDISKKYD